jgi:hypothetical protein
MGSTNASCTRACVKKGATYGFLWGRSRRFYQLDDQEKPVPFAGRRVRIIGRREKDTIFVQSIEPRK